MTIGNILSDHITKQNAIELVQELDAENQKLRRRIEALEKAQAANGERSLPKGWKAPEGEGEPWRRSIPCAVGTHTMNLEVHPESGGGYTARIYERHEDGWIWAAITGPEYDIHPNLHDAIQAVEADWKAMGGER